MSGAPGPDGAVERVSRYVRKDFGADALAGVTVAVVVLPQSMAYAILAGAPPAFGLYTSIVSCIIGALLGSSRHLVTGPTNATAVIFASTLATYDGALNMEQAIVLYTFMIGVVKVAAGLLRLGRLVNYVSDSVVTGFIAGAGILIAGNQLKNFLGVSMERAPGQGFLPRLIHTFEALGTTNPWTVGLALGTIIVVAGAQRLDRRIPGALLACVACAILVPVLGLDANGVTTTGDLGSIPRSLPPFRPFPFELDAVSRLWSGALAVAVLSLMEATAVGTSIARASRQRIDANREFIAQGLANIGGAFFSNFASSGSPVRTSLNYQSGARTRVASIVSAVCVAVALVVAGPWGELIPLASLAGLLMLVAYQMVDRRRIYMAMRAGRESTIVLFATMAAVLVVRLDVAIYIGIALSLVFFIKQSAGARITLLMPTENDHFREVDMDTVEQRDLEGEIVIVNIIGAMYFAALDGHQHALRMIMDSNPRAVILRLRRVSNIDSSGIELLEQLHDDLESRKIPMLLCGVDDELLKVLRRSGALEKLHSEHVVPSNDLMFNSIAKTVELADRMARGETFTQEDVSYTAKTAKTED